MGDAAVDGELVIRNHATRMTGIYLMTVGPVGAAVLVILGLTGTLPLAAVLPLAFVLVVADQVLGYCFFVRPKVVCDPGGITVQFPFRRDFIAWHDFRGARSVPRGGLPALGIARADGTTVAFAGIGNSAASRPKLSDVIGQVNAMGERWGGPSSGSAAPASAE